MNGWPKNTMTKRSTKLHFVCSVALRNALFRRAKELRLKPSELARVAIARELAPSKSEADYAVEKATS
jgi:post-segregation antitoxin (ccd killing protein)